MKDELAELILEQIEAVLEREPSEDALFDLLRIASPKISRESLTDEKLYKKLLNRIDVNEKSTLYERELKVMQTLDPFYNNCIHIIKQHSSSGSNGKRCICCNESKEGRSKKKGKIDISSTQQFPLNFTVFEKWPFLRKKSVQPFQKEFQEKEHVEADVAFQCINLRGAIVHGRGPTVTYNAEGDDRTKAVSEIFEKHEGYISLPSIESIKEELMKRGPVVSTSFRLTTSFLSSEKSRKRHFDERFKDQIYPVLIVGWTNTAIGEAWNIISTTARKSLHIHKVAFGQLHLDDDCIAPKQTFETWSWQDGPFFETEINEEYSTWKCLDDGTPMTVTVPSEQLCALSTAVGGDLLQAGNDEKIFTLQNMRIPAQSRSCYLKKVSFHTGDRWNVEVKFCDVDDSNNIDSDSDDDDDNESFDKRFIHGRHTCDRCRVSPILGIRYHATNRFDYDLCRGCFLVYNGDITFQPEELDRDKNRQIFWQNQLTQMKSACANTERSQS